MKSLISLLKQHKSLIIILFLVAFMISTQPTKKETLSSWDVCNLANIKGGNECDHLPSSIMDYSNSKCIDNQLLGGPDPSQVSTCLGQYCYVAEQIVDNGYNEYACAPCVPNGLRATSVSACCEDGILAASAESAEGYDYLCRAWQPGTDPGLVQCNNAEQAVGGILQSMIPSLGCKSAYWITILGGGLIAVMFIGLAF